MAAKASGVRSTGETHPPAHELEIARYTLVYTLCPMTDERNFYASWTLDRCDEKRADRAWFLAALADSATRTTVFWRGRHLATRTDTPQPAFCSPLVFADDFSPDSFVLLGRQDATTYVALDVTHIDDPATRYDWSDTYTFEDLRTIGPLADRNEASILAYARAMVNWHARHRFCGACGFATYVNRSGHVRVCSNPECALEHFPRTDPAVITLVTHGDSLLLGRQSRWKPRMYSVLAGFVEPGEDLEHAVAREVAEEAGVEVHSIRYHSSQPWPFPSSMMIAFRAQAREKTLRVDTTELEEAIWITRTDLAARVAAGEIQLSAPDSISRRLIEEWLQQSPE